MFVFLSFIVFDVCIIATFNVVVQQFLKLNLVDEVGLEPTELSRRIYSPMGLPIFLLIQNLVQTDGLEPPA